MKRIIIWLFIVFTILIGLNYFASIPYIYSTLGLSILMFVGHLVTIDDDMKGGWSSPNDSDKIWKRSKIQLLIKFCILILLVSALIMFPDITKY